MRRKSTGPKDAGGEFNPRKDISAERLKAIAGILLVWNYIESVLDVALPTSLQLQHAVWNDVTSRINGMDGKIAIFKASVAAQGPSNDVKLIISKTLNAVETYKRFRDGLIHVRIVHPRAIVADTIQRKGVADEVLISQEALDALYERLCYVGSEMMQLYRALHFMAMRDLEQ